MAKTKIEDFQINSQKLNTLVQNVSHIKKSVQNIEDLPNESFDNDQCFVINKNMIYTFFQMEGVWKPIDAGNALTLDGKIPDNFADVDHIHNVATSTAAGFMSPEDKLKLDGINSSGDYILPVATEKTLGGIKKGANVIISADGTLSVPPAYTHPLTHPATMIVEDATHRFVTDNEKLIWNAKVNSNDVYTKVETDQKIQEIVGSAPESLNTLNELAKALNDDANFASTVANSLAQKVDKIEGKGLSTNDYTTIEKNKLAGIEDGATNYVHPPTHPAAIIVEDINHRFVTDEEKAYWSTKLDNADVYTREQVDSFLNNKVNKIAGMGLSSNDFTLEAKLKLESVEEDANNYIHPLTHPATMIEEDVDHRFVTDEEKTYWNGKLDATSAYTRNEMDLFLSKKIDKVDGMGLSSNDFTIIEKNKLAGIEENANNYTHPTGDGNMHVPITGTTNNGKILKAGATNGTFGWDNINWSEIANKPLNLSEMGNVDIIYVGKTEPENPPTNMIWIDTN